MKGKQKNRVVAWILCLVMFVTSLGLDTMPAMASEMESELVTASETEPEQVTAAEEAFTYEVDFVSSYTTADMTFTLKTVAGEEPTKASNVDVFIKPSGTSEFQQIAWYSGLDNNQLVLSISQYQHQPLTPGVTYDVKIKLRYDNQEVGETSTSFTTKEVKIDYEEQLVTWFSAEYKLTIAQKEELETAGITELKVHPYLQEKGGATIKADVGGDGMDVFNGDLTLRNLKEDTEYTVYLAGTRDSAEPYLSSFVFKTLKDTRKLSLTSTDIQYCYASFNIAVTGGREDVETKSYLFLRKKGETEWKNQKQNDKKEAFSREFKMNELDAATEYEYVLAIGDDWNVNDPDEITKETHKITGSFTTPEDPRELSIASSAGYQSALIQADYTGNNLSGIQSVVHVFVREKGADEGGEEWTESKNASYDPTGSFDLYFRNLKQDTEYEYRAILNSKWDNTTANDKVGPLQYQEGSFKTGLCEYSLKITPDMEKSTYNKEYLNVQVEGSQADSRVMLYLYFNDGEEKTINLYRDEAYQDTLSITGLSADTTYYLCKYSLYVREYGEWTNIKTVTCGEEDYTFHTAKAIAPDYVKFDQQELYLNAAQAEEDLVGSRTLEPIVNEGACDEMLWESKNPSVATVDENGKVTAVAAGETEIVATSKYNEGVCATVKVSVDNFYAVYADSREPVGENVIKGLKGTESEPVQIVKEVSETGEICPVTGYSAERASVVRYDADKSTVVFDSVGETKLYLHVGEYKVRISAESYVKTAAYYVDSLYNRTYPAVERQESTYTLAQQQDYQIILKALDGSVLTNYGDFEVIIENNSDSSIEIDEETFVLTAQHITSAPVKVTISPKEGTAYDNEYYQDAVFYVNNKALPEENEPALYVYTNVDRELSDVKLKNGWKWENEKLSLYALRNTQFYNFKAFYVAEDKYPATETIRVALAEVRNFTTEDVSRTNYTVIADGEDKILVKLKYSYVGQVKDGDLSTYLTAGTEDCVVELKEQKDTYAIYEVSAGKPGSFTLQAGVRSDSYGKTILGKTITVNATQDPYVRSIKIQNTSGEQPEFLEEDALLLDAAKHTKATIDLKAITYNYAEEEMAAPKLIWTSSDKTVAQITPAGKDDTQNAKLLIKGEGNTIITVKSTDAAGISYSFAVEVKNIAPRVEGNKTTINTALDYTIAEGRNIAYHFYGFIEIAEAYDNQVTDWTFYKKTQKTFEKEKENGLSGAADFKFYEQKGVGDKRDILVMPTDANLKNGKYELWLAITTEARDEVYTYPVTVTVMKKTVKVKAVSDNINLFYILRENDNIAYTFSGDYLDNPTVAWIDQAEDALGFGVGKYLYYNGTKKKWCSPVDTTALEMNGKTPAAGTATGTLEFTFKGYRDSVKITNFKIKNCYKLPNIVTVNAATTINTESGIDTASFYFYQKDAKTRIFYSNWEGKYSYSYYKSNIEEVTLSPAYDYSGNMSYTYTGENKKENLVISLRSDYWREKVQVKHTINNVATALILEKSNMLFNWNLPGTDITQFKVKNAQNGAILKDVLVSGKNADAQKLLDENIFTFSLSDNQYLEVKLNSTKALNQKFTKDGSYAFNVTPVFVSHSTGKEVTGKACVLTIKTTAKDPEVKLSASGSIDLAKYPMLQSWEFYKNAVKLKYSFKNVNSGCEETDRKVVGDYADYFDIWWSDAGQGFYLVPRSGMEGKLKAGFVYNVQIEFTLKIKDGAAIQVVTTKPYKLKLRQSSVAAKVTPNTQIMYLSNEKITRVYGLTLNSVYYRIDEITGGLDVNKDGKDDFIIEKVQKKSSDTVADITIGIKDRDAINATAKGKNYSIPIEVMVTGADGISRNIKTQIKVTVKK